MLTVRDSSEIRTNPVPPFSPWTLDFKHFSLPACPFLLVVGNANLELTFVLRLGPGSLRLRSHASLTALEGPTSVLLALSGPLNSNSSN